MVVPSEQQQGKGRADISVVIVSWNTADLLDRCLASVEREMAASGLAVEVTVVDNASSDGTPAMVRDRHPSASLVTLDRNRGFAAASNVGIARSSGRAILLLNPDTELLSGALAALWAALGAMPHVGVVGALLLNPDGSVQSSGYRFPGLRQVAVDFFPLHPRLVASSFNGRVSPGDGHSPVAIDHPLGACMLVRAEAIDEVGLLDEGYFMYSEEIDWCRRMQAAGWTCLTAPAARVVHYGGQSTGQRKDAMVLELHRSRARYFQRYHSRRFQLAVAVVARAAVLIERLRAGSRGDSRVALMEQVAACYRRPE